ncbi:MAG TPA: hypothetical protein PKL69_03315 [Agitococcus sp.]|nr:hypothetical protein [Agitococcus sp.]HNA21422.1 hypothetical protein [Agitococcus sp.]HNC86448.1 hypothetical protein [Agitococcus sp.]HNE91549.1 hypothetical protein [Agitococcus sp.]HNG10686.1 hypothetical protein [Agitococcus sp.]
MKKTLLMTTLLFAFGAHAADMPPQGMSMAQVQKNFGVPVKKTKAVGKPPITRWVYPEYTVVFEYKHVVQSVKMVKEEATPAPTTKETPTTAPAANEATIKLDVQQ